MKYYVVADVHGFYDELKMALEEAGFFAETEPCKLVVCGDLLDRGKQVAEVVDFMLELQKKGQLIYICGNHEDLLVECLQSISRGDVYEIAVGMSHHHSNGTWDTLLQLSGMASYEAIMRPNAFVRAVMQSDFYKKLLPDALDFYETGRYVFVHGWIPCIISGYRPFCEYRYDPEWRFASYEARKRSRWVNGMELACKKKILVPGKTVVCGHFHTSYGHAVIEHNGSEFDGDADFSPFYADGIIAIDACTAFSHKVNCIVIED
jgi:serine/threonine protein phosphatase 1